MRSSASLLASLAGLALFAPSTHATANWPHWRGPDANGSSAAAKLPTKWDAASITWKTPLPGKGCSTPIVWGDRIYLTAPVDGKDAVLAFDASGKELWRTAFTAEEKGRHRNGSGSNPSPATDGKTIFVTFKSGNLAALNLDGTVRWKANLVEKFGPVKLFWDFGTSPALTEKYVILARMHQGESWLAAFDKETGEMRWKTPRNYESPREVDNGYTTPLIIRHEGKEAIVTWAAQHLTAHSAADGKLLWSCGNFNPTDTALWPAVATPVIVDGMAVVCFGRADRGNPRLHGVKVGGKGDVTTTHRVWQREDAGSFVPSPVEYKGKVYILSDRGQVDCIDPVSGKTVWSGTLPRSASNYYASPMIAGGNLYAAREDGAIYVVGLADGFKLLSENKMDDRVIASLVPAAANRLLIRGESHLYCVDAP
ncbi:MAG: PQQ-binding-like beta-propeller repeat protein [Verrucomicrobiota bacterium]